jgi:hypothetical protein
LRFDIDEKLEEEVDCPPWEIGDDDNTAAEWMI